MKTVQLHLKADSTAILESFALFSKEKIQQNEYETRLSYVEQIGCINLKSIQVNDSLSYSYSKFNFNEDTILDIVIERKKGLYFMYSLEGEIKHSLLYSENGTRKLQEFQPGILLVNEKECLRFHFAKGVQYSYFTIQMRDIRYLKEKYKERNFSLKEYREFFHFLNTDKNNVYEGSYNLRIADYIQQLQNISVNGVSSHLFFEGILYIILALNIQQFTIDMSSSPESTSNLTKKECQEVKRLSDQIIQNPEKAFTVEYLCTEGTLSPFKIQEGFKKMHGRTVADFIRNVRVEKAENLITTTDLNISEIVYSIGFTSRSYFAKIFKKKYNCSPKTYQNNKRRLAVTA